MVADTGIKRRGPANHSFVIQTPKSLTQLKITTAVIGHNHDKGKITHIMCTQIICRDCGADLPHRPAYQPCNRRPRGGYVAPGERKCEFLVRRRKLSTEEFKRDICANCDLTRRNHLRLSFPPSASASHLQPILPLQSPPQLPLSAPPSHRPTNHYGYENEWHDEADADEKETTPNLEKSGSRSQTMPAVVQGESAWAAKGWDAQEPEDATGVVKEEDVQPSQDQVSYIPHNRSQSDQHAGSDFPNSLKAPVSRIPFYGARGYPLDYLPQNSKHSPGEQE